VALVALGRGAEIAIDNDNLIHLDVFYNNNGSMDRDSPVFTSSKDVQVWLGYRKFSYYLSDLEELGQEIFKRAKK